MIIMPINQPNTPIIAANTEITTAMTIKAIIHTMIFSIISKHYTHSINKAR